MNRNLEKKFLKLIRYYTFYSPIRKGKYRLFQLAMNSVKELPENSLIAARDGRRFAARMETRMYDMVYFLGEYENYVTQVIDSVVGQDDVCFDVGANFGWFTTLFLNRKEKKIGEVHAFEPIPEVFENLRENVSLAGSPGNVYLNNLALTDEITETKIYIIDRLGSGHSSLVKNSAEKITETPIKTITLDKYLSEKGIPQVDFIKIDIEGSELKFLKGASRIFEQKTPPVMVMEMALETTRPFGYRPDELIKFIDARAAYDFYALDEADQALKLIDGFADDDIGANVLCFPKNADHERLRGLKITG